MPQVKSAIMKAPGDLRVATTAGHTIEFKANVEKFVPAPAVLECLKYGAIEIKRFRGTDFNVVGMHSKGRVTSQIQTMGRPSDVPITEEDFDPSQLPQAKEKNEPKRNEPSFDEAHMRVRNAILSMFDDLDASEFTNGKPKVSALNRHTDGMSASAKQRDETWEKMEQAGEIPEDLAKQLGDE